MDIQLAGDCTLGRAPEIAQELRQAVASGEPLVLHLDGVSRADVSFFQLLASLAASCRERSQPFEISAKLPDTLALHAARCGILACAHAHPGEVCR